MEEGKGIDHHQSAMDLMTWAMGGLLPKLVDFLKQEPNLQTTTTPIKEDIESLEIHLKRMEDALLVRMPRAQQDQVVVDPQDDEHCSSSELRELAYDIEDIVDNCYRLVLRINEGKQGKPKKKQKKNEGKQVTTQPIINKDSFSRETLDNIKVRVENLADWLAAANFVPTRTTRTVEPPCLEDGFKQVTQLVGIHKLKAELISRMSTSCQGLKIVSIWGAGGMGKTTLAEAVYENIQREFQYTAIVSLGPQPEMKKAMKNILIQLDKQKYSDLDITILDAPQLTNELRRFLENKRNRFLIVVDDVREISSWEEIKLALVDNGCGSRIITTSRVLGVAESSGEVLKLMPLSIDDSKELFYATLFCGRKGTLNFDSLDEEATEYIIQKCGCVPLAITMVASLLACKPQAEWTEVYHSIGFGQEDNNIGADENNTRKMIQFSYYDLPSHLKTCLLYLSIFPDDHVIEKDMLVWRCVAEGFVHDDGEQGESLFKVGERYLHELVSRSMIQAVGDEDTDIRVQSMVLDWIRTVAKQENFVNIASGDWYDQDQQQSSNARIVGIHNNRVVDKPHVLTAGMWKPKVRSFNGTDSSSISITRLLHTTFQALRVLSLEGCKLTTDDSSDGLKNMPTAIAGLLHLRYLGLRGTNIRDLPMEIGDLKFLQTLDLMDTNIEALPQSVTLLRQLKCLRCFGSGTLKSPKRLGNLTSLEELWLGKIRVSASERNLLAKELSKLTELRVLRIDMACFFGRKRREDLVQPLSKLPKMEVLDLCLGRRRIGRFLFPVIAPGAFPKLRYVKMDTWLICQPGAMPRLKSVELQVPVRAFKEAASFDFHHFHKLSYLRLLEKVHVGINCEGAKMKDAEEAETALRHAVQSHPNRPKLILNRVHRCVDEKQIRSFSGSHGSGLLAPQVMPLELLREITNDFSEKQRIGSGTFGTVYKGVLDGREVAVKLLHSMSQNLDYEKDFMKEFDNISRLNHTNIVQLLGYCYEIKCVCVPYKGKHVLADKTYRALCFDYMQNASLQRHLADESGGLDWQTRYKIVKGTCEGLKYLHKGLEKPLFHLDLKPDNILLDKNMVPKLADFGLSKFVSDNQTQAASSFLGTIGYCPPEHIERNCFSDKFDIFSLGVIMIEIITGPKGHGKAVEMGSQGFIDHVQENWRKRIHRATVGCTSPNCECQQVKRCIEIALECVQPDRTQRPDIEDITSRLNKTENNIQVMPLELLKEITNDFSEKQRLGSGTFGTVYKGVLDGEEVAVKLLHSKAQKLNYEEEFMKEFENLRRLNHPNIVQLLGYCYETKGVCVEYGGRSVLADKIYRALCFDYMDNGSLQQHLHDESHGLDWKTRYKIIKGTCEGLKYLHKGLEKPMFHLDLKPRNILLDKDMVPKLADFGLLKLVCDNQTQATSSFLGTIRYCPPEHFKGYLFSSKSDIFSLGVVMVEIIAGSEGYDKTAKMPSQEFIDLVQENWRKRIHPATPSCTLPNRECQQVKRCIEIALECVNPDRMQRPDIEDIISRLNETENNTEESAPTSSSQNQTRHTVL